MNRKIIMLISIAVVVSLSGLANGSTSYTSQTGTMNNTLNGPYQDGPGHDFYSEQVSAVGNSLTAYQGGGFNEANLNQQTTANGMPAEGENVASILQCGWNLEADIDQYGAQNTASLMQSGGWSKVEVLQTGSDGKVPYSNNAQIEQMWSAGSKIDIEQYAGVEPYAGEDFGNNAEIEQKGATFSKIELKQTAQWHGNDALIHQRYAFGSTIDIEQNSLRQNSAEVHQKGSFNKIKVRQEASVGKTYQELEGPGQSELTVWQIGCGNKINLDQDSEAAGNYATIKQFGSYNKLVGARTSEVPGQCCCPCGNGTVDIAVVDWCEPATQIAGANNTLELTQCGNGNVVGLYQNASTYNEAIISQTGGWNTLAVYQDNPDGYNSVNVTQTGGQHASIYQTNSYGTFSSATVIQGI